MCSGFKNSKTQEPLIEYFVDSSKITLNKIYYIQQEEPQIKIMKNLNIILVSLDKTNLNVYKLQLSMCIKPTRELLVLSVKIRGNKWL